MNNLRIRYVLGTINGLLVGLGVATAWNSFAAGTELDSDPRVFPYNGTLELNGTSFTGQVDLRFTVTDDASCTFNENHGDVSVYAGRFAVNIGSTLSSGVPACVFNSSRVYVQVGVRAATSTGAYTTLSGRQRIRPVPFALWSAEGNNFTVDGNITAAQHVLASGNITAGGAISGASAAITNGVTAATVTTTGRVQGATVVSTGALTAGSVTTTGALSAAAISGSSVTTTGGATFGSGISTNGSLTTQGGAVIGGSDFTLGTRDGRAQGSRTNQRALVHDEENVGADTLHINFDGDFESGVKITGPVRVSGALATTATTSAPSVAISGELAADNNSWGHCEWEGTTRGTSNNGETLEGTCGAGRYVAGYRRWHGNFDFGIEELTLYCCEL